MKRSIILRAFFLIGFLILFSTPAHSGGVIHAMKSFAVNLSTATQIYYPPFNPSMADIKLHGDPAYHFPELEIDLTADMFHLESVIYTINATVVSTVIAGNVTTDAPFSFGYYLDIDWNKPSPGYSFQMGPNTIILDGFGPSAGFMNTRNFQISFELNENTDVIGFAMANIEGFDAQKSPDVYAKRSNFIHKGDYDIGAHYVWPMHLFLHGFSNPPGAQILLLPPSWTGFVEMVYRFSLNNDAIDHAILFDEFSDPNLGWDVGLDGMTELTDYSDNYAVQLTTGSTASMSRFIDTPDMPLLLMFNYAFLTDTGSLEVSLGEEVVFTIDADNIDQDMMTPQRILIADREILGQNDSRLAFTLTGPSDSQMLIDNIGLYAIKEYEETSSGNGGDGDNGSGGDDSGGGSGGGGCFILTVAGSR